MLVVSDLFEAEPRDVLKAGGQSDGPGDMRRPCLELVRQLVVGRLLEGDGLDHVAPTLEGRHPLEPLFLAVEHADARRPVCFVTGEDVEVAVEIANVDGLVRHRLGTVDEDGDVLLMGKTDDVLDRRHRAERVRHLGDGHQLRAGPEEARILLHEEVAPVVDGNHAEPGALLLAKHLPGDDVGVVLDSRDDDLVPRAHEPAPVARHDQIDALRRLADEDDLSRGGGVQVALDAGARTLVGLGGPLAQKMHTTVDVRVVEGVVGDERVDDRLGLLARRRVVEVDEGLAVHLLVQGREVLADPLDVPDPIRGAGSHECTSGHAISFVVRSLPSRAINRRSR